MTAEDAATLYRLREMLEAGEIDEGQYDAAVAALGAGGGAGDGGE